MQGYQNRYIYLIDKNCKLTVPIIPFSEIDEMGAGMYKGKKITLAERQSCEGSLNKKRSTPSVEMAVTPTSSLKELVT